MKARKKLSKALHKHPDTHCLKCGHCLVWNSDRGRYVLDSSPVEPCDFGNGEASWWAHRPANGARAHRFAGTTQLTIKG